MKPIPTMALALIGVAIGVASSRALNTLPQPQHPNSSGSHQTDMTTTRSADTDRRLSATGHDVTPLTAAKRNELATKLTPEEARVLLNDGTEPAFCGNLVDNKKEGIYICKLCSLPLFASNAKFDSGTGWPSFFQAVDKDHIHETKDTSYGMVRTEISCARCDGHLGHVFDDAPQTSTGLRYCLNSVSLEFIENGQPMPDAAKPVADQKNAAKTPLNADANLHTAYFAGGCFWGVEDRFQQLPGVKTAISGYMGGSLKNPTYKQVCSGNTGHAETVKVVYDPAVITYPQLLEWFFKFHNPTQLNRQGPDIGTQYRSAIFATDDAQLQQAKDFLAAQASNPRFQGRKVVTQLEPVAKAGVFYEAEEYHQDYHLKHGGSCALPDL